MWSLQQLFQEKDSHIRPVYRQGQRGPGVSTDSAEKALLSPLRCVPVGQAFITASPSLGEGHCVAHGLEEEPG